MQLKAYMKGLEPGSIQSVGNMTIIPILRKQEECSFPTLAGVESVYIHGDDSYNSLILGGLDRDRATLVPGGWTALTSQKAQDRTIPRAHAVLGTQRVPGYCVQSSQCGRIRGDRDYEHRMLPLALRHKALEISPGDDGKYDSLWPFLSEYNASAGVQGDFLATLLKQHAEQLETFVAQFEPVGRQRGAAIIINGVVRGIDIFPDEESFSQIWETLIRDSYGMEAIRLRHEAANAPIAPLPECQSVAELISAISAQTQQEREFASSVFQPVLAAEVTELFEAEENGVTFKTLQGGELEGQVGLEGARMVYMSLYRHAVQAEASMEDFAMYSFEER